MAGVQGGGTPGGDGNHGRIGIPGEKGNPEGVGTPGGGNKELDDAENSARKRKSSESPQVSPEKEKINKKRKGLRNEMIVAVETMDEAIKALCFEVLDFAKSRNSMKLQAEKVQELNRKLFEDVLLKNLRDSKLDTIKEDEVEVETGTEIGKKYFCDRCSVAIEKEEEQAEAILKGIKGASDLSEEEYEKLLNVKWPSKVYEKTKIVTGNPVKCAHLIVCYEDKEENSTLMKIVKEKYPETDEVIEDEVEGGAVPFLESTVRTGKGTHKKRIYFVKIDDTKKMADNLMRCRSLMDKKDGKIAVAVSTGQKREKVRKLLEITFWSGDDEIDFYVPQGDTENRKERQKEEAVVIGTDVTTYADTLRNIRAVVNPEDLGIEVKTVKATKDKKVIIITKAGQAEALQKEIKTKVSGIQTRLSGRNSFTQLMILDIDASVNGREVAEYIRKSTKVYDTEVKNLKTARSGTQVATVSMPSQAAERLIREGMIKIGWTQCRVKPKIDILRCYNCLGVGHHSDICREERGGKKCLNCAQVGHLIKDCRNNSFCTTCNKDGHRTDSNNCPTHRRRIQEATSKYYENMEEHNEEENTYENNELENNKEEEMIVEETESITNQNE